MKIKLVIIALFLALAGMSNPAYAIWSAPINVSGVGLFDELGVNFVVFYLHPYKNK